MRDIRRGYCYDFSEEKELRSTTGFASRIRRRTSLQHKMESRARLRDNGNGQEKDMADVGKNIKKIRKEKNLTQDELAKRLHCTRQTVSNYENGKSEPGIDLLIEIAGVLEVQINDLIYGPKKKRIGRNKR